MPSFSMPDFSYTPVDFGSSFSTPDYSSSFSTPDYSYNFSTPDYSSSFSTPDYSYNFSTPDYSSSFSTPDYSYNFSTPDYSSSFSTPDYSYNFSTPDYSSSFSTPDYSSSFSTPDYGSSFSTPDYSYDFSTSDYSSSFSTPDYGSSFSIPDYSNSFSTPDYGYSFSIPDYSSSFSTPGYGYSFSTPDYSSSFSTPDYSYNLSTPDYSSFSTFDYGSSFSTPDYTRSFSAPDYGFNYTTPDYGSFDWGSSSSDLDFTTANWDTSSWDNAVVDDNSFSDATVDTPVPTVQSVDSYNGGVVIDFVSANQNVDTAWYNTGDLAWDDANLTWNNGADVGFSNTSLLGQDFGNWTNTSDLNTFNLTGSGDGNGSWESFFPNPAIVATGMDSNGRPWTEYDSGATTYGVPTPVIETHELTPVAASINISSLAEGRASANDFWSSVQDAGASDGSFLTYAFGGTMKALAGIGYSIADAAVGAYDNPSDVAVGVAKGVVNFGPDLFNGATNTLKLSLNGWTLIAERLGADDGTFSGFRDTDPYNITPLFTYDNKTQAGAALLTNLAMCWAGAKYGDYSVELNTGTPGTLYSNPIPVKLVAPEVAGQEGALTGTSDSGQVGTSGATVDMDSTGSLSGSRTQIPPLSDAATTRSLVRENQSADILAGKGFNVEQNPVVDGVKNPDYRVNGEIHDNYAPETSNVRNIWSTVDGKVQAGQTNSVVINLADSNASVEALQTQFANYPIDGLKQVIVIDKSGNITIIKGK